MFAWLIPAALVVGAPALKDRPKPDRPPTGEWRIEREEHDGRTARHLSADRVWVGERSVEVGNRLPFNFLWKWSAAFFEVGGEHRADLTDPERPDQPPERAIWKVEGGRLTICIGAPGGPWPTEYSAPEGSGRVLYILSGRVGD